MKIVTLFSLIIIPALLFAQPAAQWSRTYGDTLQQSCYAVEQTPDSGYVLAGATGLSASDGGRFWLVKTNYLGDTLWTHTYGYLPGQVCWSVHRTRDRGYVLAGRRWWSHWDFWLVKTDSLGDSLWSGTYGGPFDDRCYAVRQLPDGGYAMAGFRDSEDGVSGPCYWLVRTDSIGDTLWTRTYGYGTNINTICRVLELTPDGGFLLAGGTLTGRPGFGILKADSVGDTVWTRTYPIAGQDAVCYGAVVLPNGDYVLAGRHGPANDVGIGFAVARIHPNGDSVWTRLYWTPAAGGGHAIALAPSALGGTVIAGCTQNDSGMALLRLNDAGDSLWAATYGGWQCFSVQKTFDDGYAIAGFTNQRDFMLVKTVPDTPSSVQVFPLAPTTFALSQNYPNPFNPTTVISYSLPKAGKTTIKVYDLLGRQVTTLVDRTMQAGEHSISFDASNLASGIYFYQLQSGSFSSTRKMVLLK